MAEIFKVIIFGDGGVGKTSLINRYVNDIFDIGSELTKGIDFQSKRIEVDGKRITLQLWDFGGQEEYKFLLAEYLMGATGAIFMYDITRYASIRHMDEWLAKLLESDEDLREIPMLIVGSKLDLEEKRSVTLDTPPELTKNFNIIKMIECSSKTGENIEEIFTLLAKKMLEKRS